jgi:phosphomethylpyrimidine synthase
MRREWINKRKKDKNPTQLAYARKGIITEEMHHVATQERLDPAFVCSEVAAGRLIIPANIHHVNLEPLGIGIACRCKVNANIGNSPTSSDLQSELAKLKIAIEYGADTVMDLSIGPDLELIRKNIIAASTVPVGTVPVYEAAEGVDRIEELTEDDLFEVIERHAAQGVDFITVHCGLLLKHLELIKNRTTGIVSRGGALMARWMRAHERENPLYANFGRLLDICKKCDLSLSLGDGLRPGCLADASDQAQFAELETLGELVRLARAAEVQTMVEGPGHIPFDQIEMNVRRQIEVCDGAPFYVLGPLVTDIAAGHDHIVSAIGGTMAAYAGVSMLCYVTPKEHLGLPDAYDVRTGIIAHRIAAHAADIARGRPGARERDDALSRARYALDWEKQFELFLDPKLAREYWDEVKMENASPEGKGEARACSMCGPKFCPMRSTRELNKAP